MSLFTYYIIPFFIILGVLIFFHELGHFLTAKFFGVKVLRFSLGFGRRLVGKTIGETEYRISAVPLGGYVKMFGEDEDEESEEGEKETFSEDDLKRAFNRQHPLKRIAIVAAGPIFNFLLAYLLFIGIFLAQGMQILAPEVGQVREGSPAAGAGLKEGDRITAVEGEAVTSWEALKERVKDRAGQELRFSISRDGETLQFAVTPEPSVTRNIFGEEVETAIIGIVASGRTETVEVGALESFGMAARKTWDMIVLTLLSIVKLFQGSVSLDMIGGPLRIGQMTGEIAKVSFAYLVPFTAIISIGLGVLNLLPIPILDGGVIVFNFLEMVLGKPMGVRKREIAQKVGLFLLVLLMVFVFYNDIMYLIKSILEQGAQ